MPKDTCPDCAASLADCNIGDAVCPECGKVVSDNCLTRNQDETPYSVITWQFDMTTEDGREAFRSAIEGEDLWSAVQDLMQEMRQTIKHDAKPCVQENDEGAGLYNDTVVITTEHWRERLIALMHDNNVTLEV